MATSNVTLPGTGEVVSTDVLTTLNGAGIATGEEAQRMKLAWGPVGTGTDVDATTPLPTSVNASIFRFSTNNSSTVQLAAAATFTGTIETALDQPSISLLMTSDQPMTVTVQQFIDISGTFAATPLTFYVNANAGLVQSIPLNGNYVRVTAKNTGTSTTTTFNLNVAYGTIPATDGEGRTPISFDDCQPLLSQEITAAGYSTTIDTIGYQAIVIQVTGVWQGAWIAEGSNSGVTGEWDSLMVHSRDNPALIDIVTQGGLYTIRPAGRYLRLNVTNITGTMKINAIGRSGSGIDAGDYLSLAMDKANNAPLYVQTAHKQDASGALIPSDCYGPLYGSGSAVGQIGPVIDTLGYTVLCMTVSGSTFTGVVESSNDASPGSWQIAGGVISSQNVVGNGVYSPLSALTLTAAAQAGANISVATYQGRYFRLKASAYTSGIVSFVAYLRNGSAPVGYQVTQVVSGTVTATSTQPFTPTANILSSAATTNGTVVKASAGTLYSIVLTNTGAANAFFKLHNSTTITVGTTAVASCVTVPPSGTVSVEYGALGMRYGTGICYSITNLVADADTTAVTLNQVKVNLSYI